MSSASAHIACRTTCGVWVGVLLCLAVSCVLPCTAMAGNKRAFVIGINAYDKLGPDKQLERAVEDARAVSQALAAVGFSVTSGENLSYSEFNALWATFVSEVENGDTVTLYFSGHGIEIDGQNYLLPRDIPFEAYGRLEQQKRGSLSVNEFLLDLKKRSPQITLLILDACRSHPLIPPEYKSATPVGGLARITDVPRGTFIMYAAESGRTALDRLPGEGPETRHSVYTRALLPLITRPGLTLQELALQVRVDVSELASMNNQTQYPVYYDGVLGRFCLAGCEPAAAPTATISGVTPKRAEPACVRIGRDCITPGSGKKTWFKDCAGCPEMVVVPGLTQPFAVARLETTFEQWDACVRAKGCGHVPSDERWGRGKRPVINVSWHDAGDYVRWLSKETGEHYRLLSEAEWVHSALAEAKTLFWWGNGINTERGNYDGTREFGGSTGINRSQTVVATSFDPNPWGLFNVHGNVWEWIDDCLDRLPAGQTCERRMRKGGSWRTYADSLVATFRYWAPPDTRNSATGFRVARDIAAQPGGNR